MYPDYQRICEERHVVDKDPTRGRPLRYTDKKTVIRGIAFLLAPPILILLLFAYVYFFLLPGIGEAFAKGLRAIDMRLSGY
jgi:hypothetical protein